MRGFNAGLKAFNDINYNKEGQQLSDTNIGNILKAFNMKNISDEELYNKIQDEISMNLDSPEFIIYANELYKKSFHTYTDRFKVGLKKPFSDYIFKNKKDLLDFFKLTATSKNVGIRQIYCDLTKMIFCYNQVEVNPEMKHAEENLADFIGQNYINNLKGAPGYFDFNIASIINGKKEGKNYFETTGRYLKKLKWGGDKYIKCKLRYRGKSAEKMIIKMLGSEKGASHILDIINDSMGIELEAENKEDSIYLLEYEYYTHANKGIIDQTAFRQKPDFYNEADIKKFLKDEDLSSNFKEFLSDKLYSLVKKNGSNKYKDCKFQGTVETKPGCFNGLESRVVLEGNKNQSGMSASEVLDGKKVIDAMIGMRGFVYDSFIDRIAKTVSDHSGIYKKQEDIDAFYREDLIKVHVPNLKRNIYSSRWRLIDVIKNAEEYPDFIVNAIRGHYKLKGSIPDIVDHIRNDIDIIF